MSKNMLFIVNPVSGRANMKTELLDVIDLFTKNDYIVTVYTTQCKGDATAFCEKNVYKYDIVVCSGGDGTLNEVVTAIINSEHDIKVGYIPSGTTNDFANSIGISKNIHEAAANILNENEFSCDVGLINDKNFLYVAAFGIFTNVSYSTPQEAKNFLGGFAYLLESAKCLTDIKSYRLKILANGMTIEDDFIFGMISNSNSVGGFKNLTSQKVELNDGLFEVLLVKMPANIIEFRKVMKDLLSHNLDSEHIYRFLSSSIDVLSESELTWSIDGEFGGDLTLVSIKNLKEAITIML